MARPARGIRVGIFAGVIAWHALLGLLLLRPRPENAEAADAVMTWLWLETPRRPEARPAPRPVLASLVAPAAPLSVPLEDAPLPAPDAIVDASIDPPRSIDWRAEASRAVREQFAHRLPTPRSLQREGDVPDLPAGGTASSHRRGDQENLGDGQWRVWVSERCFSVMRAEVPPPPGQVKPMSVRCLPETPVIDVAALERRKPDYRLEKPLRLPPKGGGVGQTRPGPAMGGPPLP